MKRSVNRWISPGRVFHWAHRGAAFEGPQNTLWAMDLALRNGADGLELDVHRTADGHLVVCHDPTVDDTTDALLSTPGPLTTAIAEMSLTEVRRFDAGHWWSPGRLSNHDAAAVAEHFPLRGRSGDQLLRIPTLAEVVERYPEVPLNIDLKLPGYEADLADLLVDSGAIRRSIVASFGVSVQRYRELVPGAATAANRRELIDFALRVFSGRRPEVPFVAAQIPVLPGPALRRFVHGAHRCGVAVHVWTVDEPGQASRLTTAGVDGIMTNRSSMLSEVLAGHHATWRTGNDRGIDLSGPFR